MPAPAGAGLMRRRPSVGLGFLIGRVILEPESPQKAQAEIATLSDTGTPLAAR